MSFKIGGSKSKTTNTSNSTSSSTTTPIVPEWASSLTQGVAGRVGSLLNADPYQQVAPAHGLQTQAASGAAGLNGTPWNYEGALDVTRGVTDTGWMDGYMQAKAPQIGPLGDVHGASLLDNLDAYMSPYTRDVVDTALADYDFGAGQTRAQQDLELAGSGAFGGSGAALTRSMTEDALTRGRATTSAGLRDQAFTRGAALSSEDAARRQQAQSLNAQLALQRMGQNADLTLQDQSQKVSSYLAGQDQRLRAAGQLGDLASAYGANQRANIATQAEIGGALRDIDQQQRQAPVTSAQQVVAMLSGIPMDLFTGQQQNTTQSGTSTGKTKGSSWDFGVGVDDLIKLASLGKTG